MCAAMSMANPGRLSGGLVMLLRKGMGFVYVGDAGDGGVRLEWRLWRLWWGSWAGGMRSCWRETGRVGD